MLARIVVLLVTVMFGALVLEVVFGVPLGIAGWLHHVFDPGAFHLTRL